MPDFLLSLKQRIDSRLRTSSYFPFLFICFFIANNLREIDYCAFWQEVAASAIILCVASAFLFFILKTVFRDPFRAGFMTLLFLSVMLFYSDAYFLINAPTDVVPIRQRYFIGTYFIVIVSVAMFLFFSKRSFGKTTHYLNVLFFILLFYEAFLFIRYETGSNKKWSDYISLEEKHPAVCPPVRSDKYHPDIYFMVVDGCANSASLMKYWNYDNKKFTDSLIAMGFYVPANAKSNYASTPLCIASLLNADYLPDFELTVHNPLTRDIIARTLIDRSRVVKKLCNEGYECKNLSMFNLNGEKKFYTFDFLSMQDYTSFYYKLYSKTIFFWASVYDQMVYSPELIDVLSDSTVAISKSKHDSPVFVYTHFPIPHAPYYFNAKGRIINGDPVLAEQDAYLEQLKYVNSLVLKMGSEILKNTERNSIVIILGDHGSRFWTNVPVKGSESYSPLTSIYFPEKKYRPLYDSISHVNIFRTVLNEYFDERLSVLKDRQEFRTGR